MHTQSDQKALSSLRLGTGQNIWDFDGSTSEQMDQPSNLAEKQLSFTSFENAKFVLEQLAFKLALFQAALSIKLSLIILSALKTYKELPYLMNVVISLFFFPLHSQSELVSNQLFS